MPNPSDATFMPPRDTLEAPNGQTLSLCPTAVMGIINVTPDSFSDGGRYTTPEQASARAATLRAAGAAIVDIGGESTRPGATPVSTDEELARVMPVIERIRHDQPDLMLSLDTSNPVVMQAGLDVGVAMINDVRGLEAPGALEVIAATGALVCVMHHQGEPAVMQAAPSYVDIVSDIRDYLRQRVEACVAAGIPAQQIVVDPGFGFGKRLSHNLSLLGAVDDMSVAGCPVLMGVSRKSMFAKLYERDTPEARLNGSLGAAFWAASRGVGIIRAHDVQQTADMVTLAYALAH